MKNVFLLIAFFFFESLAAQGKKQSFETGLQAFLDRDFDNNGQISFYKGLQGIYRYAGNSAVELSITHSSSKREVGYFVYDQYGMPLVGLITVRDHYVLTSLLYRKNFKHTALSIGPLIDFYAGWQQIDKDGYRVSDVHRSPSVIPNLFLKVSQEIELKNGFILEPDFRLRYELIQQGLLYTGLGVSMRKKT